MRALAIHELMHLTRIELLNLTATITAMLSAFPEGSLERFNALVNLRNIRWVLARRDFSP